jgi:hypothetical protein
MKKSKKMTQEELKISNEILKMQLNAEFGMNFNDSMSCDLPPEIERAWLKSVQRFEKAYAANSTILCYDLLGRPNFAPADVLNPKMMKAELQKLIDLLERNRIIVDAISEISDLEMYKFITEKLFQEEILHIPNGNMITHFTYSEFPEE